MPTAEQFLQTRKKRKGAKRRPAPAPRPDVTLGGDRTPKRSGHAPAQRIAPPSQGHPTHGRKTVAGGTKRHPKTRVYKTHTPSVKRQRQQRALLKYTRSQLKMKRLRDKDEVKLLGVKVPGGGEIERTLEGRGALQKKVGPFLKKEVGKGQARQGILPGTGPGTEAIDLAVNTPSGVYMPIAGAKEALQGKPRRIKALGRQIKKHDPIYAAATGHPGEALKRAGERPLTTALEVSGVGSLVGRAGGTAARLGVAGKSARRYAKDFDRPALGHKQYERTGVPGPRTGRRYSKNIARMAVQKRGDKKLARRAAEQTKKRSAEAQRVRKLREAVPGTPSLRRMVDARRFTQKRRLDQREMEARQQARKLGKSAGRLKHRFHPRKRREEREARQTVVQLASEWSIRGKHTRKELEDHLAEVNKAEAAAKKKGPIHHERNREEAARVGAALKLNDDQLGKLVGEARTVEKHEHPRQERMEKEGVVTETQRAQRWKPMLQNLRKEPKKTGPRKARPALERGSVIEDWAKVSKGDVPRDYVGPRSFTIPRRAVELARRQLGIKGEVDVRIVEGARGYHRVREDGVHEIGVTGWLSRKSAARQFRHELEHAKQYERTGRTPAKPLTQKGYQELATEVAAREASNKHFPGLVERIPQPNAPLTRGRASAPKGRLARATEAQQAKAMKRKGFSRKSAEKALRRTPLDQAARALQRRSRRGKSVPEGPTERGPVMISQREQGVAAPIGLEPMRFPVGGRKGKAFERKARPTGSQALEGQFAMSERMATSAEGRHSNLRQFGVPAGDRGRVYAETKSEANNNLAKITEETGEEFVAVDIAAPNVSGSRLREIQMAADPTGTLTKGAAAESGRGRWIGVPKEVHTRFQHHDFISKAEQVFGVKQARQLVGLFKDVVLTTVNPTSWLTSNIVDLSVRGLFEGVTPLDWWRGRGATELLRRGKFGPQGEEAFGTLTGGGLYGAGEALVRHGGRPATAPFRAYRDLIYKFEHGLERSLQDAVIGKAMRQRTDRRLGRSDQKMVDGIRRLGLLHKEQIENFGQRLATDRTLENEVVAATENVIGRWGKVSPGMRATLTAAPFAQWLGAATRYVFLTLPTKHPIKTGMLAAVSRMTDEERQRLGLSMFAPRGKQAQDYQMGMLPINVGRNKYGPTVEGIRTSHMTSFGTAGAIPGNLKRFTLPQVMGPLDAMFGNSWTGDRLVYPPWWPNEKERGLELSAADRAQVGLGLFIESSIPFASVVRRNVMEKGNSSYPTSTILAPESRRTRVGKTNKYVLKPRDENAWMDWIDPAARGRVFTQEAVKAMQENEATFGPRGTMERLQKKRKSKGRVRVGASPNSPWR